MGSSVYFIWMTTSELRWETLKGEGEKLKQLELLFAI